MKLDTLKIIDPLVIMGTGPSLKSVDYELLKKVHSFGVKGSYSTYKKLNFYPTYYGGFDHLWLKNGNRIDEIKTFMLENNPIKMYFHFEGERKNFGDIPKLYYIKTVEWNSKNYEPDWDWVYNKTFKIIQKMYPNSDKDAIDRRIITTLTKHELGCNIKPEGIIKAIKNEPITKEDFYFDVPTHLKDDVLLPKSFKEFHYCGGPSTYIAAQIGILLGYKKILLIGIDCNYTNDHWNNHFTDGYRINDDIQYMKDIEGINKGHIDAFEYLANMAKNWNVEIINCSDISRIKIYPKSNLKREIKK